MKTFSRILLCGVALAASFYFVHAQETATPDQSLQAATDLDILLQALETTPPISASQLPEETHGFYSAQHPDYPPAPGDVLGLPIWPIGSGLFVLDDRNVDYDEIRAENEAAEALAAALSPKTRMSMMARSLASSYSYGNPVYLTNVAAIPDGGGNMIASFSITGGTNFVPYDILMSTNVAAPVANWNWLGIGYTSNNYTFYGQPAGLAFYILAKPSKTMTVGFGDDTVGQCDVPYGLTNALQVAGGGGQSLALKNDGTVIAWGQNAYGEGVVPTNLTGVTMITAGWYHDVALLTNGTVTAWGLDVPVLGYYLTNVPPNLTNATVISAQALHTLALRSDGTVVAWGYNTSFGETNVPAGLANVTAISAGYQFNLVVSNGTVVAWGDNTAGQCNAPTGLSNVVDVAAGTYQSLALLQNGTVVAWGDDLDGETDVPAGLSNVVAIAAGGDPDIDTAYSLALRSDGTVVAWGDDETVDPVDGMNDVIAIAAGADHALAVRTGPPTPVITLAPLDQYQIVGGSVTFNARGAGLYGVTYQWQTNGVNLSGATNAALTLTNLLAAQAGIYNVVVSDNGGMGGIVSSNANLYLVTPPVITSQTLPTNVICIEGNYLSFAATATSPYQTNGFPLTYQWQFNGTNISGATTNAYNFYASASGIYSIIVANAAGSVSASWQLTVTNAINVTNDVLLIFNTNSANSIALKDYYLAHRPMISGANVLGIGCDTNEITSLTNYISQIEIPVFNWLTNNPTKRPQYLVLFYDMPTRLSSYPGSYGSVSYNLHNDYPNWRPFVNNLNAGSLADCEAYVDKIAAFGSNYSPGQLIISASAGGYGNTNYYFDDTRDSIDYGTGPSLAGQAQSGVLDVNPTASVTYTDIADNGTLAGHITNGVNVAGYICWGAHSALGGGYPVDGAVQWSGNSGWWIIETVESFNGIRGGLGQGNFIQWFSSNAFGGINYSNTPVGAVSHTEEPGLGGVENSAVYFSLWETEKNFAICAWNSRQTPYFQAVGDPFVTK